MKTRFKHLLFAAVPFWAVQLVVLLTRYIDSRVVVQMYLPIFVVAAALLLGILLAVTVGKRRKKTTKVPSGEPEALMESQAEAAAVPKPEETSEQEQLRQK